MFEFEKIHQKPKRPNKSHYKQWYNRDCQTSQKLLKNAAKNLAHYPNDPIVRGRYHKMRKEHKKLVNILHRSLRNSYWIRLIA